MGGHGVVVLAGVGDDVDPRVCPAPLHLLPREARFRAATLVVSPVSDLKVSLFL